MRLRLRSSVLAIGAALAISSSAQAAPVLFVGSDGGATSIATMPNSVAAAAAFNTAASALGPISLINFDSNALGSVVAPTALNSQVTVTGNQSFGQPTAISNATTCGFNLCGGATSGSQYVFVYGGNVTFSFNSPISFFGAYLSGLQGNVVGQQTITYVGGSSTTVNIPMLSGGAAFVGFTEAGAQISSVTYSFGGDIVGIDDLMYGTQRAAVPEPSSLSLLGFGAAALFAYRRRQRARR